MPVERSHVLLQWSNVFRAISASDTLGLNVARLIWIVPIFLWIYSDFFYVYILG